MVLTKKADGLSLTTVVIAALALIVLIVLILIFSGRIAIFNKGVDTCPPGSSPANPPDAGCGGDIPRAVIGNRTNVVYCCPNAESGIGE
jgi:hypothetical protein